jgi:atypical dual specificity phosphatase
MSNYLSIRVNDISIEDLYNYLYWDHRIYDIRSKEDYIKSHICRSHNLHPFPMITIDAIANIDAQIDDDYGKAENPSEVIIYMNNKTHQNSQLEMEIFNLLLTYLSSSKNPSNKSLNEVHLLKDGYENFNSKFPFLCSDNTYFNQCSLLVWPSYITQNLYLGSAMCRNEIVISMLNISHIISFSDYQEKNLQLSNIKTLHWQISDSLSTKLMPVFPSAVRWISNAINEDKGTVLVHCDQGVSRSATIIIAYLLSSNENFSTVDAALNYVKSKRSVIRPNSSFLQQLEEYLISIKTSNQNTIKIKFT